MSNGREHAAAAAAVVGIGYAYLEYKRHGRITLRPFLAAGVAAIATSLPDVLEPAVHPHHRQFFHSVALAGLLGHAMQLTYEWTPHTDGDRLLKEAILVVGTAYGIHLVKDAGTPRSLPWLGRL